MGTDTPSVPRPADRFPKPRRVGCLLGCAGFDHEPGCPVAAPAHPGMPCSLDYRCKTLSITVLADPAYPTCPCVRPAQGGAL